VLKLTSIRWVTVALGAYALAGGLMTLLGWFLDQPRLTDWANSGISQMPNNALCMLISGAALMLRGFGQGRIAVALGACTCVLAAATLSEYVTGIDLGIDRLLIYREWGQFGALVPGRMGVPGATSLMVVGISIVLLEFSAVRRFAAVGGCLVIAISVLSLVGYLFGANVLFTVPQLTTIALQTSTMLLALGAGLLVSVPEAQPMRLLLADSAAAPLVRRGLPLLIAVTVAVGWLRLRAQEAELFDTQFGTALLVLSMLGLLIGVLWWTATAIAAHERAALELRDLLTGVLEGVVDAVMVLDKDWHIQYVNAELLRRSGMSSHDMVGKNIWQLFPGAVGRIGYVHWQHSMAQRVTTQYTVYSPSERRWWTERVYPTAEGGLAIFSRDITQRKRDEETLLRLTNTLRESDRRKDEFLATLAHELRNPLAPISSALEALKRAPADAAMSERLRSIMERQARQMARLIDDLLDIGRITQDKLELRREPVEIASVIRQAFESCRPMIETLKHDITIDLPPEPIVVDADPVRLGQVFSNLINNACKYTAPEGQISVTAHREAGHAVISVRDTGIGIRADRLADVFEMFTQLDRSLERSHSGLGIGLTLAKRLAEMHGGTIEARSAGEGCGSEFVVRLPVAGAMVESYSMPADVAASVSARRVLVVDDNRDAAAALAMLLSIAGHETRVAYDGLEALEAAETFRPEIVLLDIGLPKVNGLDVCRRIRAQSWGRDIILVAVTGWGQEENRYQAEKAGFDHHMVKPVEHAALMECIARWTASGKAGRVRRAESG
jgi:PAS domain S-box-containing protein